MNNLTRRRFFEDSLMAASALALPARLYAAEREATVSPNSRITAAIIGCGIRGKAHARELARLPECDIAYVCDPDLDRADEVGALLGELQRPMPAKVQDGTTSMSSRSPPPTTGTPSRRSGRCRPARMCMWKSL